MITSPALSIRSAYAVGNFSLDVQLDMGVETMALIGPNGSGKSTLLLATLGIRTPKDGRIALGNHVLFDSEGKIDCPTEERHIAYLPQDYGLFPFLTAAGSGPRLSSKSSASGIWPGGNRISFPAANVSAWLWRAPSRPRLGRCCSTSRRPRWTSARERKCEPSCKPRSKSYGFRSFS
jgi:energy-coupling factor transporter ATP-binding protein EcfA2